MPKGRNLGVGTTTLTVNPADGVGTPPLAPGSYAVLTVTEVEVGMTKEVVAHALEPFFTAKPVEDYSGLGLVPTAKPDAPAERFSPMLGGQAPSETVLLVDDEPLVRLSVAHYLGRRGYQVHEAESGAAALECLEDLDVRLLLTDMVLPDVRGPELAHRARKRVPGLRTLYMSAYPRAQFSMHELAGADGPLLEKPFTEAELALRVREALHDTLHPGSVPDVTRGIED